MPQPDKSASWRRFRRLMAFMTGLAGLGVVAVVAFPLLTGQKLHFHMMMAMGLAVVASLLLSGLLMGLVFLSHHSGHDDAVIDQDAGDIEEDR